MVSITDSSVIAAIAGTGGAIFMIGFGLLIQKTKEGPKSSYFTHYFQPDFFIGDWNCLVFYGRLASGFAKVTLKEGKA